MRVADPFIVETAHTEKCDECIRREREFWEARRRLEEAAREEARRRTRVEKWVDEGNERRRSRTQTKRD